ncbi:MAG: hypothetical protein ACK45D_13070 [Alphaproteobacteria bacterium]|jgi:hypothetical protein
MTGRPSSFTQAIADEICERLAEGESLRTICNDDDMPGRSTVNRWLAENEAFRDQYARARDVQADLYAERIVDDAMVATDAGLGRLRMDALKWAASKLAPKKYGDKVQHVGGDEGDAPIRHSVAIEFV